MKSEIQPIARIRSPYKQKFAIPRQPNLVPEAEGEIVFLPQYSDPNSLRGIEQFSHLWLLFLFHATARQGWSATVQPPRLGGKERVGVFATRSPFRPSPIGLSVVSNLGNKKQDGELILRVGGVDLLDGTPIVDIKPYVPYADSIPNATAGYADQQPGHSFSLQFSDAALQQLESLSAEYPNLRQLISSVLTQDPRPAWRVKENDDKQYGMTLYDLNIRWQLQGEIIVVLSIHKVDT